MEPDTDEISILVKQIHVLLVLCANESLTTLLRWVLGHPVVRPHQMSIAFYELGTDMHWALVEQAGPASFSSVKRFSDRSILAMRLLNRNLPWGFFDWAETEEISVPDDLKDKDIRCLLLGEEITDGLIVWSTPGTLQFETFTSIYSFVRVASEFIYRHHVLGAVIQPGGATMAPDAVADTNPAESESIDNPLGGVQLTDRQNEILTHISAGLTNEEIAKQMHLSLGTIRVETSRLYDRIGARNRQQAASMAHLVIDH